MYERRSISLAIIDSRTMPRRQLVHLVRYPSMTVLLLGIPVLLLLLFVYVFGGALGAGITAAVGSPRAQRGARPTSTTSRPLSS